MRNRLVRPAAIFLAAAALFVAPLPANAAQQSWSDPSGDTSNTGLLDIGKVTVTNSKKQFGATFRVPAFDDARPFGSVELWLDTDAKKSGPEFLYSAGFPGESGFYTVKKWRINKTWFNVAGESKCGKAVKERFDLDNGVIGIKVKRTKGCTGAPKRVRVYARTTATGQYSDDDYSDYVDYDRKENDFYPAYKKFSPWVRR